MNLFERVVSSKGGGREKIIITEIEIKSVVMSLFARDDIFGLIKKYKSLLIDVKSLPEDEEILLRQKIFPAIDEELRKIDPRYQIFATGILERIFDKIGKED